MTRASEDVLNVVRLRNEIFRVHSQFAPWKTLLTLFPTKTGVGRGAGLEDAGVGCHLDCAGMTVTGGGEAATVMTGGDERVG